MEPLENKSEEKPASKVNLSPKQKRPSLAERFNKNRLTIALVEKDESRMGYVKKMD